MSDKKLDGQQIKTAPDDPSKGKLLRLTWNEAGITGWTDHFDAELLGTLDVLVHQVRKARQISWAKCRVHRRSARQVDLDYSEFAPFNDKYGMELGVYRLCFKQDGWAQFDRALWCELGARKFEPAAVIPSEAEVERLAPYKRIRGPKTPKTKVLVRVRPEQLRFRKRMCEVYGEECAISGCNVPEALDAAHIDGYRDTRSNDPRNGLLLRRDLHALFDNHLLAIHPESGLAFFAPAAQTFPEYRAWNGRRKVAVPAIGRSYSPCREALKDRWRRFAGHENLNASVVESSDS